MGAGDCDRVCNPARGGLGRGRWLARHSLPGALLRGWVAGIFLAPVELLEFLLYFIIGILEAEGLNPGVREFPIVIEAAAIFPGVDFGGGDALAGEMAKSFYERAMEGAADVYEDAVDVEDDDWSGGFLLNSGGVP